QVPRRRVRLRRAGQSIEGEFSLSKFAQLFRELIFAFDFARQSVARRRAIVRAFAFNAFELAAAAGQTPAALGLERGAFFALGGALVPKEGFVATFHGYNVKAASLRTIAIVISGRRAEAVFGFVAFDFQRLCVRAF